MVLADYGLIRTIQVTCRWTMSLCRALWTSTSIAVLATKSRERPSRAAWARLTTPATRVPVALEILVEGHRARHRDLVRRDAPLEEIREFLDVL